MCLHPWSIIENNLLLLSSVFHKCLLGPYFPAVITFLKYIPFVKDLFHLSPEKSKNKKKCLLQSPNPYFMDVKWPWCYKITTIIRHAEMVVLCVGCSIFLFQTTGQKARLTEGCSFRWKQHLHWWIKMSGKLSQ